MGDSRAGSAFRKVVTDYPRQFQWVALAEEKLKKHPPPEINPLVRYYFERNPPDPMTSISYDGRWLAYTDWSTGNLCLRNRETGQIRALTDINGFQDKTFYFHPVWSRDISAGFRDRLRAENFTIALDIAPNLPSVSLDRDSFRQAVNNLIDNAVKYSGPSKRAVIWARKQDGHLTVSVKDFGEGILPAEQKHIFNRFYRGGRELTRNIKGSGLGLTLVKQIMTAHKGPG